MQQLALACTGTTGVAHYPQVSGKRQKGKIEGHGKIAENRGEEMTFTAWGENV